MQQPKSSLGEQQKQRVRLTYPVQHDDSTEHKEIPFVVGVIANFSGGEETYVGPTRHREFVKVTSADLDKILEGINPRLRLIVANELVSDAESPALKLDLDFTSMADFEPHSMVRRIGPIRDLLARRRHLVAQQELHNTVQRVPESAIHALTEYADNTITVDSSREALNISECCQAQQDDIRSRDRNTQGANRLDEADVRPAAGNVS